MSMEAAVAADVTPGALLLKVLPHCCVRLNPNVRTVKRVSAETNFVCWMIPSSADVWLQPQTDHAHTLTDDDDDDEHCSIRGHFLSWL